jgi:hypothetical protein
MPHKIPRKGHPLDVTFPHGGPGRGPLVQLGVRSPNVQLGRAEVRHLARELVQWLVELEQRDQGNPRRTVDVNAIAGDLLNAIAFGAGDAVPVPRDYAADLVDLLAALRLEDAEPVEKEGAW